MGVDFDVAEFCRKLRNTKQPPYECPVSQCGKIYRSLCGLQYHLLKIDHDAPTPANPTSTPGTGRKKGRGSHHNSRPASSTSDLLSSPTREGLTYAEAQKMVEFDVDGRVTRVSIYDPLKIVSKQEFEVMQGGSEFGGASQAPAEVRPIQAEEKVRLPEPSFNVLDSYNIGDAPARPNAYIRFIERSAEEMDGEVEYDMDEEDSAWLSIINERRAAAGLSDVPVDTFELLMDRLEKESYFQMQSSGKCGEEVGGSVIDDDAVCCICMDGECQNSNVILFCDMCNLAVHQDCYGVPYIPEGQWLCRRCLQSPSRAVDCVLCPNNGGAFKQTDRGHWAHVVCALWIPEVRFANTVFLEPIDSIETIPPARWKLTCYICKQRGVGACIQCHKTNCYAAFHVTCAQHAGLFMKMDTVKESHAGSALEPGPVLVQKTAFCDSHTPADADSRPRPIPAPKTTSPGGEAAREESRQKMKKARRILAKKRSSIPVISIPTIPPDRIQEIASLVELPKKSQLMQRLIAYWTLKRQFRNGVPLLRRLQSSHLAKRDDPRPLQEVVSDIGELYRQLKYWQCLRQDLERARLLCELVRKRERLKTELTKVKERCLEMQLDPVLCHLRRLLEAIQCRDAGDIFSEPVDASQVPDYGDVVKRPMDLSTMRSRLEGHRYATVDSFEADFDLMIANCMAYNSRDTIFYRAAVKMRDQCGLLIRQARRDLEGLDPSTGQPDSAEGKTCIKKEPEPSSAKKPPATASEDSLAAEMDKELTAVSTASDSLPYAERLSKLLELQDRSLGLKQGPTRAKRQRLIKTEITKMRRKMALGSGPPPGPTTMPTSPVENATGRLVPGAKEGSDSDTEHEDTSDEEVVKPESAPRHATRRSTSLRTEEKPNIKGKRGRRKKGPKRPREEPASTSQPAVTPSKVPTNQMLADTSPSLKDLVAPVTPVKMSQDLQLTISPSGVNRRTAVLFTRKAAAAAAFRRPETPSAGIASPSGGAQSSSSRRRVGRPRKNLDSALAQAEKGGLLGGSPGADKAASLLMPAPPVPFSESFRVYRSGGDIPAETDEETQSDSSCSTFSSTDSCSDSSEGGPRGDGSSLQHSESSGDDDGVVGPQPSPPEPLDLVWAKCRGYPWYPALIINPKMPRTGYLHNGVPIPAPPTDVLALANNYTEHVFLVLFFDAKRTWQWLPRNKLESLGVTTKLDQAKLTESRKPTDRKAVRKAYQEALQHRAQVSGGKKGKPLLVRDSPATVEEA